MGTYKVIQDIEADDKLIGWMTPRQAIYATIVVISGAIGFLFITKGAWWAAIPLLPHMILFAVLAGPFMHDQPAEVWLLAKIQFFLKPRKRIWDQSGISELVTITVPKKIERILTDGLSQTEVKSRLQVLANVIDSRGWSTKNIATNPYGPTGYAFANSDRLVDTSQLPQQVPAIDVTDQEDILDEQMNPTAQHLQQMIAQSSQAHREQVIKTMHHPIKKPTKKDEPAQQWFANDSNTTTGTTKPTATKHRQPATTPAQPINPVVQQLANNDDLNIATIARQANKATGQSELGNNEVVISLH